MRANSRKAKPSETYNSLFLAGFEPPGYVPDQRVPRVQVLDLPVSADTPYVLDPSTEIALATLQTPAAASHVPAVLPPAVVAHSATLEDALGADDAQTQTLDAQANSPITDLDTLEVLGAGDLDVCEVLADPDAQDAPQDGQVLQATCGDWPAFDIQALDPQGGAMARTRENLEIIELSRQIEKTGEPATHEQRTQMLRYAGWGGMPLIFNEVSRRDEEVNAARDRLRTLVGEEGWKSLRASTPNAHYTDPRVTAALWAMVRQAGFEGGRVVEPAAGTGLFLAGMPQEMARNSQITAVELDTVSGTILKQCFEPLGARVFICGMEKAPLPDGYYDLVIGNVPFGEYQVPDTRRRAYSDWSIHNWFIARAVDLVRPGGLVAVVTSTYTLDAKSTKARKWLDIHAELLGAWRLPEGAFKYFARTEVATDVLLLRRREVPDFTVTSPWAAAPEDAPEWAFPPGTQFTQTIGGGRSAVQMNRPRLINPHYARDPMKVLGQLRLEPDRWHTDKVHAHMPPGQEIEVYERLTKAAKEVPADAYKPRMQEEPAQPVLGRESAKFDTKLGQFVMNGERLMVSEGATWLDVDHLYRGKLRARVLGMMALRDAAREVLDYQVRSLDDEGLKPLQQRLGRLYDQFVKLNGYLFDKMNQRAFKSDPDFPLVMSLEDYDEEAQVGHKTDIFHRRTVGRTQRVERCANAKDAMLVTLAESGRIVLKRMQELLGKSEGWVRKQLVKEDLAYRDPADNIWRPTDEYLSGHIERKLELARAAGHGFERNVAALEGARPKPLGPGEIQVRLGAPWIPNEVVKAFMQELMSKDGNSPADIEVSYSADSATWSLGSNGDIRHRRSSLETQTWGTAQRNFYQLVEAALNQQPPTITVTVDGRSVVERTQTLAAREKYEAIRVEFARWAYADPVRRDEIVAVYNKQFNQIVPRRYDGAHLKVQGLSTVYQPFPHQLNAVWRIIAAGNTLLAHAVGAGKSLTMMMAAMELKRLGKAQKPLHVVPNHMLVQYTAEFVRAFPTAKVLMASAEDLGGDKRRMFCARIATGDWDSIVMTHATFERLACRPETVRAAIAESLERARIALTHCEDKGATRAVKEVEKRLKALEAQLEKAADGQRKDDLVYFDDLGVDYLFVDELHLFKNLMRISKMPRVAGLPNTASQRAFDLLIKTRVISDKHGGQENGMVGATATPIANSIAEMHVMQRFIQPRTLEAVGLSEFDAWAATFGEAVTGMEVAPDGSGYRLNTRFARFVNVPELMAIFRTRADIQTRAMLKLPTPKVRGGRPIVHTVQATQWLKELTKKLVKRAELVRSGAVKPNEDNMLKITHEGRLAALDMRLIQAAMPADASKLPTIARECMRIYRETDAQRGAQMVFCDIGTPSSVRFSVYAELRRMLVDLGVPLGEIAFIHDHDSDAAKAKLFRAVREGQVRFLLGSTSKMGVGTNAQKRLKAVHQIDAPWRPCDVEQRDGRGLRMGNTFDEIELLRYVTEGSFDAYQWQILETKAGFIEQVMSGDTTLRSVEDIGMMAMSYAEIKALASGNPLVLEKATIDAQVLKYSTLRNHWEQERWLAASAVRAGQARLESLQERLPSVERDAQLVCTVTDRPLTFEPSKGAVAKGLEEASTVLERIALAIAKASALAEVHGDVRVGAIGPFEVNVRAGEWVRKHVEMVLPHSGHGLEVPIERVRDIAGNGQRVEAFLREQRSIATRWHATIADLTREIAHKRSFLDAPFEHQDKLNELQARQSAILSELDLDKAADGAVAVEAPKEAAGSAAASGVDVQALDQQAADLAEMSRAMLEDAA